MRTFTLGTLHRNVIHMYSDLPLRTRPVIHPAGVRSSFFFLAFPRSSRRLHVTKKLDPNEVTREFIITLNLYNIIQKNKILCTSSCDYVAVYSPLRNNKIVSTNNTRKRPPKQLSDENILSCRCVVNDRAVPST